MRAQRRTGSGRLQALRAEANAGTQTAVKPLASYFRGAASPKALRLKSPVSDATA